MRVWVPIAVASACLLVAAFILGGVVEEHRATTDLLNSLGRLEFEFESSTSTGGTTTSSLNYATNYDGTVGLVAASILGGLGVAALLGATRARRRGVRASGLVD